MTRIYLTDQDYAVINRGNPDEIKRHFNDVRGQLETCKQAEIERLREIENNPLPAPVCKRQPTRGN